MATVSTVYNRRVMVSDKSCADSGSCCIGYETAGSGTNKPQWRSTIFAFTVSSTCSGLDVSIALAKVSGNTDAPIYGKIFQASVWALNDAVVSVVGTSNGTYLCTIPASGGNWSSGYTAAGRVLCEGFIMQPGQTYYLVLFSSLSTDYNNGYYSTSYSTSLVEYSGGFVRLWNGSSWIQTTPYVWNGSSWVRVMPYIYNGSSWVLTI